MVKIEIDKIIRSKRRTLALEVTRDASVILRVPKRTSMVHIEKLVYRNRFWIQKRQKIAQEKYKKFIPKEFVNGEGFLYLGNTYRLVTVDKAPTCFLFDKEFRLSKDFVSNARQIFIDWYRKQSYKKIKERLDWYSASSGFKYNSFNITNAQKRWGSCNNNDNLYFSWRLIMAPLGVIDYVVVHELCHLEEKNHSSKFWNKVSMIIPNYQDKRQWFKNNEHLLTL